MRKVILGLAVSLDGYIEGPNGEYDWCFTDQDYGLNDFMKRIDAILMGRKSYEVAQSMEGTNPWDGMTTYVFSRTRESVNGNAQVVKGELADVVATLKAKPGKDIWLFGGAELTTGFINAGLIDAYWLAVHPIILGSGKPLFQHIDGRKTLRLLESKTYDTGLVSLWYAPA
ncbi:MAG TPA: dihydrofolate reductase family protein [Ohtaekwangia sp.]|nr:dihydrofolate reductase family protein [Ohtaekwangia sp.]